MRSQANKSLMDHLKVSDFVVGGATLSSVGMQSIEFINGVLTALVLIATILYTVQRWKNERDKK